MTGFNRRIAARRDGRRLSGGALAWVFGLASGVAVGALLSWALVGAGASTTAAASPARAAGR